MKRKYAGGVALLNGILFMTNKRQVKVERRNNDIYANVTNYVENNNKTLKNKITSIPFIRGIFLLYNQIKNSGEDFIFSLSEIDDELKKESVKGIGFAYILLIFIITLIPIFLSFIFKENYRNIAQTLILLIEVIVYLIILKSNKSINKIFMYHGAEHKAVNAYDNNKGKNITIEDIKKSSRFHKRCGGNVVSHFVCILILEFLLINILIWYKVILMPFLGLLDIGIAYEIIFIFSNLPSPLDYINYPFMIIQLVTTKEPTDDMIELARYGINGATRTTNGIYVKEYITSYINSVLTKNNIAYDIQDIYSIISSVLNLNLNKLITEQDKILISLNNEIKIDKLMHKYYFENIPLAYITHHVFFYNEEYYVDENVLIPRPDTEILVSKAIEYIKKENLNSIIDLCTGSGAIGISIIKNTENTNVELIDISNAALNVARRNSRLNNVDESRIKFTLSDLLSQKINEIENIKVDMIVSNPPYIKTKDIASLDESVKKEPLIALDGGNDGMDIYRRIIEEAKKVLKPSGYLLFEIGYDELDSMKKILANNSEYMLIESIKDYGGNDRVVVCRFQ